MVALLCQCESAAFDLHEAGLFALGLDFAEDGGVEGVTWRQAFRLPVALEQRQLDDSVAVLRQGGFGEDLDGRTEATQFGPVAARFARVDLFRLTCLGGRWFVGLNIGLRVCVVLRQRDDFLSFRRSADWASQTLGAFNTHFSVGGNVDTYVQLHISVIMWRLS